MDHTSHLLKLGMCHQETKSRERQYFLKVMKIFKFICSNYPADSSGEENKIIRVLLPQQNSCN